MSHNTQKYSIYMYIVFRMYFKLHFHKFNKQIHNKHTLRDE